MSEEYSEGVYTKECLINSEAVWSLVKQHCFSVKQDIVVCKKSAQFLLKSIVFYQFLGGNCLIVVASLMRISEVCGGERQSV